MKKGMVMSVVFLGGFAAGALTYGFVAARETQFQNELIQTHFRIEQEFRASRAERGGNLLAALHYRWNSVDAHSRSWMNAIQSWEVPGPWYPVQLHILRSIRGDAKRYEKGVRIAEAIGRGHLAWLLDANGFTERAAQEWERSAELTGRSVAHQKELIHLLRESFDTDAHKAAEVAVLGP